MLNVAAWLIVQEMHTHLDTFRPTKNSLKIVVTLAMQKAKEYFFYVDESGQFRVALDAVGLYYGKDSEECKRIDKEFQFIQRFQTFVQATDSTGIRLQVSEEDFDGVQDFINLLQIWNSIDA